MNLNDFGANLITQLTRIADALESNPAASVATPTTANSAADAEPESKPAAKKTTQAAAKKPATKRDFAEVKAILITVKDTIGKEAAQDCYRAYEYTAMSKIQPEHYDAIFDIATKALEEFEAGGDDDL